MTHTTTEEKTTGETRKPTNEKGQKHGAAGDSPGKDGEAGDFETLQRNSQIDSKSEKREI